MVQVKTFEFKISCGYGSGELGLMAWKDKPNALEEVKKCVSADKADKKINKWLSDMHNNALTFKVINIMDQSYTLNHHNNAGINTVVRRVTIIYEV